MLYTRKGDSGTTKTLMSDLPAYRSNGFFVYVILCEDKTLYIGQTNDLKKQWVKYKKSLGPESLKKSKPLKIIHYEEYSTKKEAIQREKYFKTEQGQKWLKYEFKNGRTAQVGQRISKSSKITEALGSVDELNANIGLLRASLADNLILFGQKAKNILFQIQNDLFIIQAELAGADKHLDQDKIIFLENFIDKIEKKIPPITSFFIAGENKESALVDVVRTVTRRAERRVVEVVEEGKIKISDETLMYLNRLSSFFYALERWINHESGVTEQKPNYS